MKLVNIISLTICTLSICGACTTAEPPLTATVFPPTATPLPPTDTPAPPTDTPVQPTSTFTETPTETAPEFPSGEFYNGSFLSTLIINEDGTWNAEAQGNLSFVYGNYQVEGNQVVFSDESAWCSDLGDGIFTWEFVDGTLSLKTVEDACDTRIRWLTLPYKQR